MPARMVLYFVANLMLVALGFTFGRERRTGLYRTRRPGAVAAPAAADPALPAGAQHGQAFRSACCGAGCPAGWSAQRLASALTAGSAGRGA